MSAKNALMLVVTIGMMLTLTSCGSSSVTDQPSMVVPTGEGSLSPAKKETAEADDDQVGPEFTHPTMDQLRGIPQKFPAKYTLKRYPHSKVLLARVYPDLRPGWKNQVMLRSDDRTQQIATFYRYDLAKGGWTLVSRYENSRYSSTVWQKNGQEVEVRVAPDPQERNDIQLFCGPVAKPVTPAQQNS